MFTWLTANVNIDNPAIFYPLMRVLDASPIF